MPRPRRRSPLGRLLELPPRLLFGAVVIVVQVIIFAVRFLSPRMFLLLCAVVAVVILSYPRLDTIGRLIMLAAALMLAFAAGSLQTRR